MIGLTEIYEVLLRILEILEREFPDDDNEGDYGDGKYGSGPFPGESPPSVSETIDLTGDDETQPGQENQAGVLIEPQTDLNGLECTLAGSRGLTMAYLKDELGEVLETRYIGAHLPGDSFFFGTSLTAGERYQIVCDANGESYERARSAVTYPLGEDSAISAVAGIYTDGGSRSTKYRYNFRKLRGLVNERPPAPTPVYTSYKILEDTEYETTVYVYDSGKEGPTTFVTGGVHGDEPAGWHAAEELAGATVPVGRLVVLPRANVPAIDQGSRGAGYDLNRRFPTSEGSEPNGELARAIWSEIERHDPDYVFDLHTSWGVYKNSDPDLPSGVGQAIFPTGAGDARDLARKAIDAVNSRFPLTGDMRFRMGNTLTGRNPMIIHRVHTHRGGTGAILEATRQQPLDDRIDQLVTAVSVMMKEYGQEPDI